MKLRLFSVMNGVRIYEYCDSKRQAKAIRDQLNEKAGFPIARVVLGPDHKRYEQSVKSQQSAHKSRDGEGEHDTTN